MGKKLYVGNLAYNISTSDLEQMFAAHGKVSSVQVITDRGSGKSKGFAFVEMGADDEAQAAILGLNGKSIDGRGMAVSEARSQEARSSRDSGEGSQNGGSASD